LGRVQSRLERSWTRLWHWYRRWRQRSCKEDIYMRSEEGLLHALWARRTCLQSTCHTTWATCYERQATSAPLWPSGMGGRQPPLFCLTGSASGMMLTYFFSGPIGFPPGNKRGAGSMGCFF
jgi:hypothetical protein